MTYLNIHQVLAISGYMAMRVFLNMNGYDLKALLKVKYEFVMEIAQGMEEEAIAEWLKRHTRKITRA